MKKERTHKGRSQMDSDFQRVHWMIEITRRVSPESRELLVGRSLTGFYPPGF